MELSCALLPRLAAPPLLCMAAMAQSGTPSAEAAPSAVDKRLLGVLPNYRTVDAGDTYAPLGASRKFYIGYKESTDYPVYGTAAVFAGLYQIENTHPRFGPGAKGYGKRFATAYADQAVSSLMTVSILPSLLREDPRYFRRGSGSAASRFGYAVSRLFVTRTDAGGSRFNFSEVFGNAITAGVGNAYYPGERRLSNNAERLYTSLTSDALSLLLREFWPDIRRRFLKR